MTFHAYARAALKVQVNSFSDDMAAHWVSLISVSVALR